MQTNAFNISGFGQTAQGVNNINNTSYNEDATGNNMTARNMVLLNKSQENGASGANDDQEGYTSYLRMKQELDDTIKDLDVKLNRVLAKQEYEYLKGYNVYVK